MTQQEQLEFQESLAAALAWVQAVQERLRANDNTQGPRNALEARLRETEKIHASEHEGRVLMDKVLVAAEVLLQGSDEEQRSQTHAELKVLKGQWEETCTYIIHCHSRIEWVWLHWSEYLKAHEEFELWLVRLRCQLDAGVEQQLGAREKLWQVDHQRVAVSDVHGQAALLERLLDEAAALHSRTQDPSVAPPAQEALREAYSHTRDRAEERLSLLQKIAEEHQAYQGCVQRFQSWLLSKTKELTELLEREDTAQNRLKALQALDDSVAGEERTLQHIEGVAEAVRSNTSPAGAELVVEEAEELRLGWQRLRQGLCEAGEGLRASLDARGQYLGRRRRLGEDIGRLRTLLQELGRELEEGREAGDRADRTEEQLLGQWKTYTGVRNTLTDEEPRVEQLKAQLKELFRFSEDSRHLSDDVLAVVKEHQSVKCRAARLCSESESGLRQVLQDPLHFFTQWSDGVSQVLEASAEVTDFSHVAMLVQSIERQLKHSVQLQERLSLLQAKDDLLAPVFGSERAESLKAELATDIRNRELLHAQLVQRKSRLQGLISRTKHFGEAYESIRSRLAALRDRLVTTDILQPDILAKKSQSDQLRVIQKDLEECEAHITALETLVSSSATNRAQFERLYADWKLLYKAVRVKVNDSEESIGEHESFHESLLNVEKWLMIMRQKLESFHSPGGEWSVDGRQHEAERALGEFPEKELQLHQMEAHGLGVLELTSEEGRVHIQRDMKRLRESWMALHELSLNLYRLLNSTAEEQDSGSWRGGVQAVEGLGAAALMAELPAGEAELQTVGGIPAQASPVGVGSGAWVSQSSTLGRGKNPAGGAAVAAAPSIAVGGQGLWNQPGPEGEHLVGGSIEEVDSPFWGARLLQSVPGERTDGLEGSFTDGSPGKIPAPGGASSGSISVESYGRGPSVASYQDHGVEEERGGAEGLGQGGGAFTLFRRSQSAVTAQGSSPGAVRLGQGSIQRTVTSTGQLPSVAELASRRKEFEAWLCRENELLSGVLSTRGAALSSKELRIRQDTLRALRAGVSWGQEQFQLLVHGGQSSGSGAGNEEGGGGPGLGEDFGLEDLRYRWMLYKSKLKEVGDLRARLGIKAAGITKEVPVQAQKGQKQKGPGLLHRVCRVALPLWLLFLALLLLAFLLPFMDGSSSCSLSNNFARSFNIMLRYEGPPPT